ncbi:MAG: hypothetical protein ACLUDG_08420 [Butyricicoccus sp.]
MMNGFKSGRTGTQGCAQYGNIEMALEASVRFCVWRRGLDLILWDRHTSSASLPMVRASFKVAMAFG